MPFETAAYLSAMKGANDTLFGGVSLLANSIGEKIKTTQLDAKKLKAYRAMAVDGLGLDAEQVDKLDLPTLEGKFQALSVKKTLAQLGLNEAQTQATLARIEDAKKQRELQQAGQQRRERTAAALARVLGQAVQTGAPAISPPGPFGGPVAPELPPRLDRNRLFAALQDNPEALADEGFAPRLNALAALAGGEDGGAALVPGQSVPVPGADDHLFVPLSRGSGTVIKKTPPGKPAPVYTDPDQPPKSKAPDGFEWAFDGEKWKHQRKGSLNPYAIFLGGGDGGAPAAPKATAPAYEYEWKDGKLQKVAK